MLSVAEVQAVSKVEAVMGVPEVVGGQPLPVVGPVRPVRLPQVEEAVAAAMRLLKGVRHFL